MLTAYTKELDDIDAACNEIVEQLDLDRNRRKNSVGLITCDSEFIESGVVEALCKRFDFDTVGITTRGTAVNGQVGFDLLSIAVLTSDDVRFSAVMSDPILIDNIDAPIEAAYRKGIAAYKNEKPSLILVYPPLLQKIGNGRLLMPLKRINGDDIPVFGTLSCDTTPDFSSCRSIYNGTAVFNTFGMVFLFGEVRPQFFRISISPRNVQKQYAVVTDAEGFVVKTINDIPFSRYLQRLGFTPENFGNLYLVPFVVSLNNSNLVSSISCSNYSVTEEGYGIFGEEIPVGSTITLGELDTADVLKTTKEIVTCIANLYEKDTENASCALMYSCLSRGVIVGSDYFAELNVVSDTIANGIPFQCCYSGGEICPVPDKAGNMINITHNLTFIACVFT
ncbi:MAG: FIST C-terminal domain-containing protein [Treponema sp.]|nr:FIST C-terminal domain-containing protein [Treponema sp.]